MSVRESPERYPCPSFMDEVAMTPKGPATRRADGSVTVRAPRGRGIERGDETETAPLAPHQGITINDVTDDIQDLLGKLDAARGTVTLYKSDDKGKWPFVAEMSAAEFKDYGLTGLAAEYGGGDYKVIAVDPTQGALNPVHFSIDRRYKGKQEATTTTRPRDGSSFEQIILARLLERAIDPPPQQPAFNPSDMLKMFPMMLAAFAQFAQAFRPTSNGVAQPAPFDVMMEVFTKGMEIGSMNEGGDGISKMLPSLLQLGNKLVDRMAPNGTPNGVVAALPALSEPQPPIPVWLQPFANLAPLAIVEAESGSDGGMFSGMALAKLQRNPQAFNEVASIVQAHGADGLARTIIDSVPVFGENESRQRFVGEFARALADDVSDFIKGDDDDSKSA